MTVLLVVVIVVVILLLISPIVSYNRFVRQRNLVAESWRQIDVELQRRHDLIPNLVQTVQAYATHERQVFDDITRARAAAMQTSAPPRRTP
jgi:LemA protein